MIHQRLKVFWINKINTAITVYSINSNTLTEGVDWKDKLNALSKWKELDVYGKAVFRDVFTKANQAIPNPLLPNSDNYGTLLGNAYEDLENEYADLVEFMKTRIGVDPTDATLATDNNGDRVPQWKQIIKQKLPNNYTKLTDIPAGYDLADILYARDLYLEIVDNATGLNDIIERNLTAGDVVIEYGFDFLHKVNKTRLQEYKNTKAFLNAANKTITDAEAHLGLTAGELATINTNPNYVLPSGKNLRGLITHTCPLGTCPDPSIHTNYNTLKGESDHYQRIHTKLNGKVSDSELQALLDATPCSHIDYDTIKQERDQLKSHQCDCASQVAQKETEIINKIITDLQLSTERERESLLEAVITEIKNKITPPTDSADKQKITELEAQITNLQTPKSLNDLPSSKEVKAEVIKISQELGLTAQSCAKLETATSYQELSNWQKEAYQEKLNSEIDSRKSANYLNWGLGALSLGSLLILAWILIKRTNFIPELGNKKDKKE